MHVCKNVYVCWCACMYVCTLHWLPVRQRIHYRLSTIVWRCALGIAPTYLLELFILTSSCNGRQSLRSASRGDFVVPHARTAIKQHRAQAFSFKNTTRAKNGPCLIT